GQRIVIGIPDTADRDLGFGQPFRVSGGAAAVIGTVLTKQPNTAFAKFSRTDEGEQSLRYRVHPLSASLFGNPAAVQRQEARQERRQFPRPGKSRSLGVPRPATGLVAPNVQKPAIAMADRRDNDTPFPQLPGNRLQAGTVREIPHHAIAPAEVYRVRRRDGPFTMPHNLLGRGFSAARYSCLSFHSARCAGITSIRPSSCPPTKA